MGHTGMFYSKNKSGIPNIFFFKDIISFEIQSDQEMKQLNTPLKSTNINMIKQII